MSFLREITRPCRATKACLTLRGTWPQNRPFSRTASVSAPITAEEVRGAHKYCVSLLSKYDRPSYTLSTFIPPHARSFYIALRALNVSLSMIADTTSSHTIGLMRLQFWRDAVTKTLAGAPPKEPVAILLASAISELNERTEGRARITKGWLTRLINAREQTLTNDPYPNIAALESYAENTYSTLMYLTLAALPMTSVTADHVASHIGKAVGIAAVLRGLPLVAFPQPAPQSPSGRPGGLSGGAKQGAVMLPLDIMAQHGVKEEEVLRRGAEAEGLRDAVFAVATRASDHLITVDQMLSNLRAGKDVGHDFEHEGEEGHEYDHSVVGGSRGSETPLDEVNRAFGVFMPAIATRLWLDRLQQYDFDVFRPELLRGDWRLPWKSYMAFRRKHI
ncbi:uncharacterized protein N7482_007090 [Penicillium canariense]|uniref:Squalene/phytoene synthase n=1 Tax=Penicillium canariense TaxID=189055 RepID=A0A9W9HYT0_9EURO|nr:uncharacterized protein N7482_007090 [Penicillium canariense]KAJ5160086.1 hypothetical protein N7482_007090 [Penicillium canariense]